MKCFELRQCSEQERKQCFVYLSYPNKQDLDGVKCWILNGAFQKGNRAQLEKCQACPYYKANTQETQIVQTERTRTTIISVSGAINNNRARALEDVLASLLEKKRFHVVLNLADVNNIYSCGLGTIIRMHKDLVARGGMLVVSNPQPYVFSIFESTKLTRFLKIAEKEPDALALVDQVFDTRRKETEAVETSKKKQAEQQQRASQPCWEFWKNRNPKNANTCDECFRKQSKSAKPCWVVEGSVEGVSFQYVNEDCEGCQYYLLQKCV